VLERGEHAEAVRLAERVLHIDARHGPTLVLKARALTGAGKRAEALSLLESVAAQDPSPEAITPLLDHYVEGGHLEKAATLAEKLYAREPKHYVLTHRVAAALLDAGDHDRAQLLLGLIRNTMTDAGEHETLAQTLSRLAERRVGQIEPLEWLVDLYGRASDSFRLPDALAQLAQALEAAGEFARALETYEKLLDRNREDEPTRRHCVRLRANLGIKTTSPDAAPPVVAKPAEPPPAPTPPPESGLDEETQRYVTQALTEVDLFSSYGLNQKAIDLLETVLQRAPKHSAALERLLDFYVGAGNDRRTAELATLLEQIAVERNDRAGAERYADIRHRFQRAAGISSSELPAKPEKTSAAPQEFAVPTIEAELTEPLPEASAEAPPAEGPSAPSPATSVVHEVDLSDEWAALSVQLDEVMKTDPADAAVSTAAAETRAPSAVPVPEPKPEPTQEPVVKSKVTPDESSLEIPAFDLVPQPPEPADATQEEAVLAESFLKKLANDLEDATLSLDLPAPVQQSSGPPKAPPVAPTAASPLNSAPPLPDVTPPQVAGGEAPGPLGDLFEEFRNELGEAAKEEVDLETHYNLGIAYREMGLLEEAISEFQRVAKENNSGSAFRYGMQCCTLLGLAFMEKGQPAIAAMWYQRALQSPKLDAESILALRYDLGVAQELAGEIEAAFKSFSEVYAMNIDYRDVAERIALLGKAR
jgi:tetratricopeptide (TPR) repeat protein